MLLSAGGKALAGIGPPHLHGNRTGVTLTEGQTLQLTCRGGYTLEWHYPQNVQPRVQIQSTTCLTCDPGLQHTSVIIVADVKFHDAGKYVCFYSRYSEHINNGTSMEATVSVTSQGMSYIYITINSVKFHKILLLTHKPLLVPPPHSQKYFLKCPYVV